MSKTVVTKYRYAIRYYTYEYYPEMKHFEKLFDEYGAKGWRVIQFDRREKGWVVIWEYPEAMPNFEEPVVIPATDKI